VAQTRRKPIADPTEGSQALVTQNLGLVRPTARHYANRTGIDYDDLFQAGTIGLIRASRIYDPSLGWRFSTIAVRYIKGSILHHIRDHGYGLKFPREWRDRASKVRELASAGKLTVEQIGAETSLSTDDVNEILSMMHPPGAIDEATVTIDGPGGERLDEHRTRIALQILAHHAFEAVGSYDQPLLLGLDSEAQWPAQAVERFDAWVRRALGRSRDIHAAAEAIVRQRTAEGRDPLRLGSLRADPTPSPMSLEGRRRKAQKRAKGGQQTDLPPAGGSPSAETSASSGSEDPGEAESSGAAPATEAPSAPLQQDEGSAGRPRGRGRRSRPGASASAGQKAGSSFDSDGPDVTWT
jgi:RNA polymerase sigma factor (sigma-70 family)